MEKNIINKITYIAIFSVLVALVFFKILDSKFPDNGLLKNIFTIINVVGIGVQMFLYNKLGFLIKIFDKSKYIAGDYKGTSKLTTDKSKTYVEDISIKQTLLTTKIEGVSMLDSEETSIWHGQLIDYIDNNFVFYISISNDNDNVNGILTLAHCKGVLLGYYYSTKSPERKAKIKLEKVKK